MLCNKAFLFNADEPIIFLREISKQSTVDSDKTIHSPQVYSKVCWRMLQIAQGEKVYRIRHVYNTYHSISGFFEYVCVYCLIVISSIKFSAVHIRL